MAELLCSLGHPRNCLLKALVATPLPWGCSELAAVVLGRARGITCCCCTCSAPASSCPRCVPPAPEPSPHMQAVTPPEP